MHFILIVTWPAEGFGPDIARTLSVCLCMSPCSVLCHLQRAPNRHHIHLSFVRGLDCYLCSCFILVSLAPSRRFSHLLPYTGPHEHDQLTSEFLEYQTMTLPPETEPDGGDMAHFWAEMANHKHKVW